MTLKKMEQIILKNLLSNEPFTRKVLPYLKPDYFQNKTEKTLFEEVEKYVHQYNTLPTLDSLTVSICAITTLNEAEVVDADRLIQNIKREIDTGEKNNDDWLDLETESFCKEQALHNALRESIAILDPSGKSKLGKGAIPQLMTEALSISFNPHIGHDYLEDSEKRFEFYHKVQRKLPFNIDFLDRITKGGLSPKTLNVFIAGTNVGKSLVMCHCAAAYLMQQFNVLYITMEMSEEKIAERIDANLFDVPINDIVMLRKEQFEAKIRHIRDKVQHGKLVVQEYPTAAANVNHFRALLQELRLKKQFKPDVIIVDYINICTSARVRQGQGVNSYTLIKSISEELRGLAVEQNVPLITATQTNRSRLHLFRHWCRRHFRKFWYSNDRRFDGGHYDQ